MTAETESPLKRLIEAGNDLIAEGLAACKRDNPTAGAAVMAHAAAGAVPRLTIETHPEKTTVAFHLVHDEGDPLYVFRFDLKRVPDAKH